jgi:hypothetical protein
MTAWHAPAAASRSSLAILRSAWCELSVSSSSASRDMPPPTEGPPGVPPTTDMTPWSLWRETRTRNARGSESDHLAKLSTNVAVRLAIRCPSAPVFVRMSLRYARMHVSLECVPFTVEPASAWLQRREVRCPRVLGYCVARTSGLVKWSLGLGASRDRGERGRCTSLSEHKRAHTRHTMHMQLVLVKNLRQPAKWTAVSLF